MNTEQRFVLSFAGAKVRTFSELAKKMNNFFLKVACFNSF